MRSLRCSQVHGAALLSALVTAACAFRGKDQPTPIDPDAKTGDPADAANFDAQSNDAAPSRVTDGLIAKWRFNEATGAFSAVDDVSVPLLPAAPLGILSSSPANFAFGGGQLTINNAAAARTDLVKAKLPCETSRDFTVELWFSTVATNDSDNQLFFLGNDVPDQRFISIRNNQREIDVQIDDGSSNVSFSANNALPSLNTIHQIVLRKQATTLELFVDANSIRSEPIGANVAWRAPLPLVLFAEPSADPLVFDRFWSGKIDLAAFYCTALSDPDIGLHRRLGANSN